MVIWTSLSSGLPRSWAWAVASAVLIFAVGTLVSADVQGPQGAQSSSPAKDSKSAGKEAADAKAAGQKSAAADDPTIYRVGPEDQLQISVWHEPELSGAPVVRPDGKINLPLLGEIYVVGQTPEELQAMLTIRLKEFVNDPQVAVIPQQIRSRKVSLVGQVIRQGTYQINGKTTVVQLIAEGGGLAQFARPKSIYILRKKDGQETKIPVNYKDAIKGRGENPLVFPGDTVVVP
jgi:polysaccharide export outer membrane protein